MSSRRVRVTESDPDQFLKLKDGAKQAASARPKLHKRRRGTARDRGAVEGRVETMLDLAASLPIGSMLARELAESAGRIQVVTRPAGRWRHYVTDPEVFFGQPASYTRDNLLDSDEYDYERGADAHDATGATRWRLLVLEDTGELVDIDAKLDVGQGLSRLLNIVDGLLGQGLRLLVLITTRAHCRAAARRHAARALRLERTVPGSFP